MTDLASREVHVVTVYKQGPPGPGGEPWDGLEVLPLGRVGVKAGVGIDVDADGVHLAEDGVTSRELAAAAVGVEHLDPEPLREWLEDRVAALLGEGANVDLTYTDNGGGAGTLTIAVTGLGTGDLSDFAAAATAVARAAIGVSDTGTVNMSYNGATGVLSADVLNSPALGGMALADVLDRDNHTGEQLADTIGDFGEAALDAVGFALADSATVEFAYDDGDGTIAATVLGSPTVGGFTAAFLLDRGNHTGTQLAATISDFTAAVVAHNLSEFAPAEADLDLGGFRATNAGEPEADDDLATRAYVDRARGVVKVLVAAVGDVDVSNPGATLDGIALTGGHGVLLTAQADPTENGPWTWVGPFVPMVRHQQADTDAEVTSGLEVRVVAGTYAGTRWVLTTPDPIALGATALTFVQDSGLSQLVAGPGIAKVGNTISIVEGAGIQVDADGVTIGAGEVTGGGASGVGGMLAPATVHRNNVASETLTDAEVADANKDGLVGVPSLRTLGFGATQAFPGDTNPATRIPWGTYPSPAGMVAQYRPVTGGASTVLPADLVLPSDGSTFDLPLVVLTDPATLTETWTAVDPDLIAGADGSALSAFTPADGAAFSQATGTKQPTIERNELDGHSAIQGDGGDAIAQAAGASKPQRNVYVLVAESTNLTDIRRVIDSLTGSTSHLVRQNAGKWEMSAGAILVGPAITAGPHAVVADFNGAASSIAVDGGTPTVGDAGTQAPTGVTLFANSGQSTHFWQGRLYYAAALTNPSAGVLLGVRRYLQERFPSVAVLAPSEMPTNAWYPEGYVQIGPNAVLHYTGKTANKLTGCRVVVGVGTIAAGAALSQARPGLTSAAAVRTPQAVPLVGANLAEQLGEVASHLNEQGINVARAPYFASPVQTPLYNSEAINAAMEAIYTANGERGGKVTIPRYTADLLVDPTTGSGVAANRKSITFKRPHIEVHILPGSVVKAAQQSVDQYDVVFAGYGGGLGYGCTLRVDGRLLGDLRGRTVQSGGGPQTGHAIRLGAHDNFRICGTGVIGESWGDLLYVGEEPFDAVYRRSKGLIVGSKLLWTDARREAIGAFNGDDMTFLGLRITDVGKLANAQGVPVVGGPQRGFDVEPNVPNPERVGSVRNLVVVWAKISGCYGAGFVLGAGQGAILDQVTIGVVSCWNNGLSANFNNDEGIIIASATNLQAGLLMSEGHMYGHGVEVHGDCSGRIESIVSSRNLTGFRSNTGNGSFSPALSYGSIKTRSNLGRGIDLGLGRDDIRVGELDSYGDSLTTADPPVRITSSGGKLRAASGRIRRGDEEQFVRVLGSPTGGSFTLALDAQVSAGIAHNATTAQVQAALEALPNIGAGNVVVSGGALPALPIFVRFIGALAGTDQSLLVGNGSGLTGGTSPSVVVEPWSPGGGNPTHLLEIASGSGHEFNQVALDGKAGSVGRVLETVPGTIFRNCPGLATSAKGNATIPSGSTFVDVPHGLGRRPLSRDIAVKPTNDLGSATKWWVSAVGLTTFRLNVNADPGASGAKFSWSASVETSQPSVAGSHLITAGNSADQTSYSTANITPGANRLVLIAVRSIVASGTPNVPTVTGNGLTWEQVETVTVSTRRLTLFRAQGAAPTLGAVTMDFAGQTQTGCAWTVVEAANVPAGSNGANAIGVKANNSGSSTPFTVTLPAFDAEGSATFGFFSTTTNEDLVPGSGFAELGDAGHSNPGTRIMSQWRADEDSSVDASWATSGPCLGIAVEVKANVA